MQLGKGDVVLVAGYVDALALMDALSSLGASPGGTEPAVVVLGDPATSPLSSAPHLDVTFIPTNTDNSSISRCVLKAATSALAHRGVISRRPASSAPSARSYRHSSRPSRAPSRPSVRHGLVPAPSFFQADLRSATSSTSLQALRIPEPPRLPSAHGHELATASVMSVTGKAPRSLMPNAVHVEGSRWLLLDDDVARAHAIASAIDTDGGHVEVSGLSPTVKRMGVLRDLDASGVLVSESSLPRLAALLEGFEGDSRLRWVPVVPVRWGTVFDEGSGHVDREALKLLLLPHWQPDHDLIEKLFAGQTIEVSRIGPAKLIRAAAGIQGGVELEFQAEGQLWVLALQDGELLSVQQNGQDCVADEAGRALDAVLNLTEGSACLLRADSSSGSRALGQMVEILKAQASYGAPVVIPGVNSPLRVISDAWFAARQRLEPVARHFRRHWGRLSPNQRNVVALVAGVVTTSSLAAVVLTNPDEGPPRVVAPAVTSVAPTRLATAATSQAPLATAPAVGAEATASSDAPTAGVRHDVAKAESEPEVEDGASAPSTDYPPGCSRWITAQPPVLPQPHQATAAWRMARKAIQHGNLAKAEELLCVSVSMDSMGPGAAGLVKLHFSQGNIAAATRWAEWGYGQKPNDPENKQLLADVRNRQGRTDEARALLHDAMSVSAADVRVLRQVARKYANAGYKALQALDPGQAERLFRRAITLDAKNVLAVAGMAEVTLRAGELESAMEYALRAAEMNPRTFEVQMVLGDVYAETKQEEKAKRAWLEAARMRPSSKEARKRLGL